MGHHRGNCPTLPGMWLQVPDPSQKGDAGAAQSFLPALLSSWPLKSRATAAIGLGQLQGWPVPRPGLGRAVEGESAESGTGAHGDSLWEVQVNRDKDTCSGAGVPEGATSLLRWRRCNCSVNLRHSSLPRVLSYPAMASHRHGSSHGVLSLAIWLDHITPIPPHLGDGWHLQGQMSQRALSPQGSFQTRQGTRGHPSPGVQEHRLMQAVPWEAPSQPLPAAAREQVTHLFGDPWSWGPCPAPQHPVGPGPCSALPQGRADTRGKPRGESPDSGTTLGCATSCHHDLGGTGRRHGTAARWQDISGADGSSGVVSQDKGQGQRREPGPPGVWGSSHTWKRTETRFCTATPFTGPGTLWCVHTTCMGSPGYPCAMPTTSITPTAAPGCTLGTQGPAQPTGKVGGDGVTPGVSQHLGLSPSPKGCPCGKQPSPLLAAPPGQLPLHGQGCDQSQPHGDSQATWSGTCHSHRNFPSG